ncbi:hypothetical protein V9L05_18850 [Bernardetia sp. Wsw4-3y2]|uniref:hypothetical protein n=1 Tax=Bernardetia sp. Wsw4-3y2 TaxID=3127471 RepID=UPI0030D055D0
MTVDQQLTLIQCIREFQYSSQDDDIVKMFVEMVEHLKDKENGYQLEIEKQLDVIYRLVDEEPPNVTLIEQKIKETGLQEHPEILRIRTMVHFMED